MLFCFQVMARTGRTDGRTDRAMSIFILNLSWTDWQFLFLLITSSCVLLYFSLLVCRPNLACIMCFCRWRIKVLIYIVSRKTKPLIRFQITPAFLVRYQHVLVHWTFIVSALVALVTSWKILTTEYRLRFSSVFNISHRVTSAVSADYMANHCTKIRWCWTRIVGVIWDP